MSAYDDLYEELGDLRRLGHMSSGWTQIAADLDRFVAEVRAETLREAIANVEDPAQRTGLGWESARDVLRRMSDNA
jgi:hypothetical protein